MPLIAAGGIENGVDAYARIRAGASLVQLYTALVYQGPGVARAIAGELPTLLSRDGFERLADAVGAS
jgi:dihydroorotate dehydrogenase